MITHPIAANDFSRYGDELKSQPLSHTYQQICNRWHERESGLFRVLEDLRIITKLLRLSKTRVKAAGFFYLNEAHKGEHETWSIVTRKCMVEESLRRMSRFLFTSCDTPGKQNVLKNSVWV